MTLFQPPYPPQELQTGNNFSIKQDDSGRLGIFNPSGDEIGYLDSSGDLTILGNLALNGNSTDIFNTENNWTITQDFTGNPGITANFIDANIGNAVGNNTGGKMIASVFSTTAGETFPTATNTGWYGLGISTDTLEIYTDNNINFWQVGLNVTTPAFSIGGADNAAGTYSLIKTANNTLDDGSGNMSIVGNITMGSQKEITWTNTASGNVGNMSAVQYTNRFAFVPSSTSNYFELDTPSNAAIFQAFPSGKVNTAHNTLDDGSGNMTITGQFASAYQLETSIQTGGEFYATDWIGFAQMSAADGTGFINNTGRTIFALVFWNSSTNSLTTSGTVYINIEQNTSTGKIYMLVMENGAEIVNSSTFTGYGVFWWGM